MKIRMEHRHELRLAAVLGCFGFATGLLMGQAVASGIGWTTGLAEILTAIAFGLGGIILGSGLGFPMDRRSERREFHQRSRASFTGRKL